MAGAEAGMGSVPGVGTGAGIGTAAGGAERDASKGALSGVGIGSNAIGRWEAAGATSPGWARLCQLEGLGREGGAGISRTALHPDPAPGPGCAGGAALGPTATPVAWGLEGAGPGPVAAIGAGGSAPATGIRFSGSPRTLAWRPTCSGAAGTGGAEGFPGSILGTGRGAGLWIVVCISGTGVGVAAGEAGSRGAGAGSPSASGRGAKRVSSPGPGGVVAEGETRGIADWAMVGNADGAGAATSRDGAATWEGGTAVPAGIGVPSRCEGSAVGPAVAPGAPWGPWMTRRGAPEVVRVMAMGRGPPCPGRSRFGREGAGWVGSGTSEGDAVDGVEAGGLGSAFPCGSAATGAGLPGIGWETTGVAGGGASEVIRSLGASEGLGSGRLAVGRSRVILADRPAEAVEAAGTTGAAEGWLNRATKPANRPSELSGILVSNRSARGRSEIARTVVGLAEGTGTSHPNHPDKFPGPGPCRGR